MKPKTIIFSLITALVLIILFNNMEEATFWLFGDIRTSKLLILGVFFLLGIIVGGLLFRRKRKNRTEYHVADTLTEHPTSPEAPYDHLSEEDRKFLGKE